MTKARFKFPSNRTQCVWAGAALGALAFLLLYGVAPLDFTNDVWLRGGYVEADPAQHYAGWLFYRASGWSLPLGIAQNMGTYVGFSDSIPLFALLFKLFSPLLPATFQYFGLWGFLCSVLQGASAALLLSLFTQKRLHNLLLCMLFVLAPILGDRMLRHGALSAQWLILLALYLYIKHRRSGRFFSPGLLALCMLAISIHPYFVPMVLAVAFALVVENAVYRKKWLQPLGALGLYIASVLVCGLVLGAFTSSAGGGSTPYGYFSMNLNALFNPTSRDGVWSLFLPVQNQTLGNYDGFNYLGLGVLLALAGIALDGLVHFRRAWALAKRLLLQRFGLVFISLCLGIFAVSNTVTAQGRVLLRLPLPWSVLELASVLRSSGRMFWPVWYLLVLGVCVWFVRRVRPPQLQTGWLHRAPLRTVGIVLLVLLQLADLSPALVRKGLSFRPYVPVIEERMQSRFWQSATGFEHIASLDEAGTSHGIELALFAVDHGMTTDDAFTARHDSELRAAQVAAHRQALLNGTPQENTLYVTTREAVFLDLAEALQEQAYCAKVDDIWYVIAPYGAHFAPAKTDRADLTIDAYPLLVLDYSDANWDHGVLVGELDGRLQTIAFEDTAFTRSRIVDMYALRANGVDYPITHVSFKDAGWIMVTLDIDDAHILLNVPLTAVPG